MLEKTPAPAPGEPAADDASDFLFESASVAFVDAPTDTTVGRVEAEPPLAEPVAAEAPPAQDGEVSASAPAAKGEGPVQPAATTPKTKKKGDRPADLQRAIDKRTYELRETERKIAERQRELAALGTTTPKPAAPEPTPAETAMPEPPKYRDFETDELFEAAVATWRTDMAAWQTGRETALEQRITTAVDGRFKSTATEADTHAAETRLRTTLGAVYAKHADWDEKVEALGDLRSSWYEPSKHGESQTPFLTDLSKNRMAAGHEDGAELLYLLASDPDRAQGLADLLPSRPMRDALIMAPAIQPLLDHFASDAGAEAFERINRMHPILLFQAIGALSAQLQTAPRGSVAAAHPITSAVPPVKPPGAGPSARPAAPAVPGAMPPFDEWMASEDARDLAERKRSLGLTG
jgi:hypothetical protein